MGTYVNSNLTKKEYVLFETTYHWIIFCSIRALFSFFLEPILAIYAAEFVITNKRVILKTGIVSRKAFEMNLSKIESVNVDQNIPGRILGYGTITVIGIGGTRESFENISEPLKFRQKFLELTY